jgi:hypothetical protein
MRLTLIQIRNRANQKSNLIPYTYRTKKIILNDNIHPAPTLSQSQALNPTSISPHIQTQHVLQIKVKRPFEQQHFFIRCEDAKLTVMIPQIERCSGKFKVVVKIQHGIRCHAGELQPGVGVPVMNVQQQGILTTQNRAGIKMILFKVK